MNLNEDFLLGLIVGCEISFWLLLAGGLAARYLLKWQRVSTVLLFCVPLIDLILLGATIVDLRNGATATLAHGLAAAYIGFTVAFGSKTIQWADRWFAFKFGSGERPHKAPTHGVPRLKYDLVLWGRCVLAVIVMHALLGTAILLVADSERTEALEIWFPLSMGPVFTWFVFGPFWSAVFVWRTPRK